MPRPAAMSDAGGQMLEALAGLQLQSNNIPASVAAAGTDSTNFTNLPTGGDVYQVTGADGTKGVGILAADAFRGNIIIVGNLVANQILKIYPPAGGAINGASANAAYSTASGKGAIFVCITGGASSVWVASG